MTRVLIVGLFALSQVFCAIDRVSAQGWGTIKGKFVVTGEAPTVDDPTPKSDKVCIEAKPAQQELIISEANELKNVVIYLREGRNDEIEAHPDYKKAAEEPVVLDNKGCVFLPHITLVQTNRTLEVKNSDPTLHNTKGTLPSNGDFNITLAANATQELSFEEDERLPMPVECNVHPYMKAYIVIRNHPYMAISAADGTFEIKNIPAGEHEFQFWHEMSGYLKDVETGSGELSRTGRIDIEVPANGVVDLGTIEVPAELFED